MIVFVHRVSTGRGGALEGGDGRCIRGVTKYEARFGPYPPPNKRLTGFPEAHACLG